MVELVSMRFLSRFLQLPATEQRSEPYGWLKTQDCLQSVWDKEATSPGCKASYLHLAKCYVTCGNANAGEAVMEDTLMEGTAVWMESVIWNKHNGDESTGWSILYCSEILNPFWSTEWIIDKSRDNHYLYCAVGEGPVTGIYFTFPPGKNHRLNFPRRNVWPIQQQQQQKKSMCLPARWGAIVRPVLRDLCV